MTKERMALAAAALGLGLGLGGCKGSAQAPQTDAAIVLVDAAPEAPGPDAGDDAAAQDASGDADAETSRFACSDLFDPGTVREFAIDISPAEWDAIDAEFHNVAALQSGLKFVTYHPVVFHMGNEVVTDAAIKLHGQSSWLDTLTFDGAKAKMQFTISFEQNNPVGRFHGVGKITLDMPRTDFTFIHERLANTWLRQIGIMAPCSGSARLVVNGTYYGLYVAEESVGPRLLQEYFPGNADGDLWKGAQDLQTGAGNWSRITAFKQAADLGSITAVVDLKASLLSWAAEAVLNDSDGYYGGMHNFLLYDQGAQGYLFIPTDTDATFDWLALFDRTPFDDHPVFWWSNRVQPAPFPGKQWPIVFADQSWRQAYADALATQLGHWDVQQIQGWIDEWSQQIQDDVAADPHALATPADFEYAVRTAKDVVAKRPVYLESFIDCEQGGGDDKDGDGFKWCDDCNDDDATIHLGARERCGNQIDDNCNGVVDEGCGPPPAAPAARDGGVD